MTPTKEPAFRWNAPDSLVALAALLAALAVLYGTADGTTDAARQGVQGIHTEAVLSAAAAARNQVAQAGVLAAAEVVGVATEEELEESVRLTEQTLAELERRLLTLESVAGPQAFLSNGWISFGGIVNRIVEAITSDRLPEARTLIDGELDVNYRLLIDDIVEFRNTQLLSLELAQDNAGRVANAARFAVAFLIPLVAILAFRRNLQRRQKQAKLLQEVENQREATRAKDEAIANLSHELRTPLTSIYGFALAMVDDPTVPREAHENAVIIASEAADLSRMVDDLLIAAKSDNEALAFHREVIDPVLEVKKTLESMAQNVEVHTLLDDAPVLGDRVRFRQVLRNLIANALRHGAPPMAIRGWTDSTHYVLDVIDSGPGVPSDIAERIFERYVHRGDAPLITGSVGLGLSIARLLVEGMGGQISYRRLEDLTMFEVRLPLAVVPVSTSAPMELAAVS